MASSAYEANAIGFQTGFFISSPIIIHFSATTSSGLRRFILQPNQRPGIQRELKACQLLFSNNFLTLHLL
jgi:hypothetical protein